MSALLSEFAAAADQAYRSHQWMAGQGMPFHIDGPARIGVARVRTSKGFYEPDIDGQPAFILPVGECDVAGWLRIHDLIAVPMHARGNWFRRIGQEWLVGAEYLDQQYLRAPVVIYPDPLRWHQGGRDGVCVLDWSECLLPALRGYDLICTDRVTASRLTEKLRTEATSSLPVVRVWEAADAA